jgi:tRNA-specific 2-thiouridylase
MSGGVDSSVVAALAAQSGAEVIGITLQLYDHGEAVKRKGACCAGDDIRDARAVADRLGIAHYVFDHESAFREAWSNALPMITWPGAPPSPASAATWGQIHRPAGHGARPGGRLPGHRPLCAPRDGPGGAELHRALDPARDQSYFLYATTEAQLDFLRFPLGGLPKPRCANWPKLRPARRRQARSQDICFVPDGDYASVVRRVRPEGERGGDIVHAETGAVLGQHKGVIHYTVGQRRGLEIGGQAEPLYVVGIDAPNARCWSANAPCWPWARRITETNRIGPLPAGGRLTAKVRSLASPCRWCWMARWAMAHDPLCRARIWRGARAGSGDLCRGSRGRRRLDRDEPLRKAGGRWAGEGFALAIPACLRCACPQPCATPQRRRL